MDDEPYDEVLCPYDIADELTSVDDELRSVIANAPNGVRVTAILDNCHSGTATRSGRGRHSPGHEAI